MKIIGHRGARGLAPENTLAAFQIAIDCKVDMIETDVRQTKDGRLVLFHDADYRSDGTKRQVADSTYNELAAYQTNLVTLEDAIRFIDRRVRLMIEVKKGVPTKPVAQVVRTFLDQGWQPSDFMFNSASYQLLRELKHELPMIERIIQGNWSGVRVQWLARRLGTEYILLDQRYIWWGYVKLASKRFKLMTYTYPWPRFDKRFDHFRAAKWERDGLYALITDYPDHFKPNKK